MDKNVLTDLGENYKYARIILDNTIELKKIEFAEKTSSIAGKIILTFLVCIFAFLIALILLAILSVLIYNYSGSVFFSMLSILSLLLLSMFILFILRKRILYRPITKAIYATFLNLSN